MKNIVVYTIPKDPSKFKTLKNWMNNLQRKTAEIIFIVGEEDTAKIDNNTKHNLQALKNIGEPISFMVPEDKGLVSELFFAERKREEEPSDLELFSDMDMSLDEVEECKNCSHYSKLIKTLRHKEDTDYSEQLQELLNPIYIKLGIDKRESIISKEEAEDLVDELEDLLRIKIHTIDLRKVLGDIRAK